VPNIDVRLARAETVEVTDRERQKAPAANFPVAKYALTPSFNTRQSSTPSASRN
jgi:hypothetical protein